MRRSRTAFRTGQAGFTIVELLTVIAIISILASLLVTAVIAARRGATRKSALMFVMALANHLESYKTEYGELPEGDGGVDSAESLYKSLTRDDGALEPFPFNKDQLVDTDDDGEWEVCDVWGTPVSYYKSYEDPQGKIRNRHIIISAGPNHEHDEGASDSDDIDSWKK